MKQVLSQTNIKGRLLGECNRTVCMRVATWWSSVERACYCKECAEQINRYLPPDVKPMVELVTLPRDDQDDTVVHFASSVTWAIPKTSAVEHPFVVLKLHTHGEEQCVEICAAITPDEARGTIEELTAWLDKRRTH